MDLFKLQNSSDIRGTAIVNEGEAPLNPTSVKMIAYGFVKYLEKDLGLTNVRVGVGHDSRVTANILKEGIIEGLYEAGADKVYDFHLCSTPAMFMSTTKKHLDLDGAIEITASHLPFDKNGMKFFTKDGGTDKDQLKKILTYAMEYSSSDVSDKKAIDYDFITDYSDGLVETVRELTKKQLPFEGMKVLVDAGNGASGFFAEKVLSKLGADTSTSMFLEPDGHFPNHVANPEDKFAMDMFCENVKKADVDCGIIFDTDGDRAALCDHDGKSLGKSKLIALLSDGILKQYPGSTIVTDSVTSTSLKPYIEARGGIHHRFKRGYNNVINEAKRLTKLGQFAPLAIETSGHGALMENFYLDDGAYLSIKALIILSQLKESGHDFSNILSDYKDANEAIELRPEILVEDFRALGEELIFKFTGFAINHEGWSLEEPNYEGVRVNMDEDHGDGFILMRLSLHEPVLPINIESSSKENLNLIMKDLRQFMSEYKESIQEV